MTRRDGKHSYERPSRCVDIPLMNARSQYSASRQARFLLNHCRNADTSADRISFTVTQNMFIAYVFRRQPSVCLSRRPVTSTSEHTVTTSDLLYTLRYHAPATDRSIWRSVNVTGVCRLRVCIPTIITTIIHHRRYTCVCRIYGKDALCVMCVSGSGGNVSPVHN